MNYLVIAGILLFTKFSLANSYVCHAQKSVMKINAETRKVETRRATTPQFQVTSAEHEEPKTFEFVDESGTSWGSVAVATGSHVVDSESWFYANAMITKQDGNIIAFLVLKMPVTSNTSTASTLVFDENEEMPPSLSITCTGRR